MTREELLTRLQRYEWADIEFKEGRRGVPRDAYKTVSAFANTAGGWLVFGVRDTDRSFEVVGVVEVDKVQNDFLSTLRAGDKLNRVITVAEDAHEMDGKTLLVFHVPESPKDDKPVYLGGDIRQSFIRRGAGDERCTMREIERFLRDASDSRYDAELLGLDAEKVFDADTLRWYRRVFEDRNPGLQKARSNMAFLHEWGFVKEREDGRVAPTRAAVLMLGRGRYVRQVLARPVVDCRMVNTTFDMWDPDLRWDDRIVVEENLVQAWLRLSERFVQRAERPFRIDPNTMRRDDDPPDYISFREATINLLLHQDYGDQNRHASIRLFRDRMEFKNPGDAFATTDELLEPGEKEVRNSAIVAAFRRLGLSEQAGTGIRSIFRNWQALGYVPPVIDNDKAAKAFMVCLPREVLVSDAHRHFQSERLGLHLTDAQSRTFAFACRERRVSLVDAKAVTGLTAREATPVLEALETQGVLQRRQEGLFGLAEHLETHPDLPAHGHSNGVNSDHVSGRRANMVTDQGDHVAQAGENMVTNRATEGTLSTAHGADLATGAGGQAHAPTEPSPTLTASQQRVLAFCDVPRLLSEIMEELGAASRTYFKRRHIDPLLDAGLVTMTNPTNPRARGQRYILTEAGVRLRAPNVGEQAGKRRAQD